MDKLELKWFTACLVLGDWKNFLVFVLILSECKGGIEISF